MVDINVIAYRAVMAVVHSVEFIIYFVTSLFPEHLRRGVRHEFKKADIRVDVDDKLMRAGDMRVNNKKFWSTMMAYRTMGLGESYMDGWWECTDLEEFYYKIYMNNLHRNFFTPLYRLMNYVQFQLFNLQTEARSWEVGEKHYDQGNTLFEAMLDKTMNYSCGYWKDASDLDEAQINKMNLIARKLQLKPGMRVLDIGCGWGALCKYLAENYAVEVVGITISVEGAKVAKQRCEGLPVDIRAMDYRDMNEKFDRIVSVGMFEHVGPRNYPAYFKMAHSCLKDDGIFLLHTIGVNHPDIPLIEPWFNRYIFPNGILPRQNQITKETDGLFMIEDWQNLGFHYCKTLRAWLERFNMNWPMLKDRYKEPEKFYRMWTHYLQLSAASFRSRKFQCWQVVLVKNGVQGGYDAPR